MIYGVFGKPRSGKSTFLAKYVSQALRARQVAQLPFIGRFLRRSKWYYDVIFSTSPMRGTVLIKPYDVGAFEPPLGMRSLYVIHEAGVSFNNRNFKSIPDHCTDFFAMHGHYNCDIIYDSQTVDIDKKLRNRTQNFYVVSKCPIMRNRSKVVKVKYWIGVNKEAQKLDECYTEPQGIIEMIVAIITRQRYTFNRRGYYWLFDSFSRDLTFRSAAPAIDVNNPYPRWRMVIYLIRQGIKAAAFAALLVYLLARVFG